MRAWPIGDPVRLWLAKLKGWRRRGGPMTGPPMHGANFSCGGDSAKISDSDNDETLVDLGRALPNLKGGA